MSRSAGKQGSNAECSFAEESEMTKSFNRKELERRDGRDGRPACVVVDGVVYDVSKSGLWKEGIHMDQHTAGRDLTAELMEN